VRRGVNLCARLASTPAMWPGPEGLVYSGDACGHHADVNPSPDRGGRGGPSARTGTGRRRDPLHCAGLSERGLAQRKGTDRQHQRQLDLTGGTRGRERALRGRRVTAGVGAPSQESDAEEHGNKRPLPSHASTLPPARGVCQAGGGFVWPGVGGRGGSTSRTAAPGDPGLAARESLHSALRDDPWTAPPGRRSRGSPSPSCVTRSRPARRAREPPRRLWPGAGGGGGAEVPAVLGLVLFLLAGRRADFCALPGWSLLPRCSSTSRGAPRRGGAPRG
jgi:hypothetical protein